MSRFARATSALYAHVPAVNRLPQELVDHIAGYLADDMDALKSCALVGPAWAGACRLHLFRDITLGPRQLIHDRSTTLQMFSVIPSLRWSIVSVTISSGQPVDVEVGLRFYPPRLVIDPAVFATLLQNMPRLHTLELNLCAIGFSEDYISNLLPHCAEHSHLRSLTLTPSFQNRSRYLDAFRMMVFFRNVPIDILRLCFSVVDWRGQDLAEQGTVLPTNRYDLLLGWRVKVLIPSLLGATHEIGPPLRIIPLWDAEYETLLIALLRAGVVDTLRFGAHGVPFTEAYRAIIARYPPENLETDVVIHPPGSISSFYNWSHFAQFTGVRTFRFVLNTDSLLKRFGPAVDAVLPHLPRTLRAVAFELRLDATPIVSPQVLLMWWERKMQWERLAQRLERFGRLEELHFGPVAVEGAPRAVVAELNDEMRVIVERRMQELVAQGKVKFIIP
ncbi:hypothetical protein PsYK624_033540 [Phanerochaete sordida]|uniref:F-box domain-containing protein n=1 Tax=Phanerochaete sordida TaxID=48140 RepID=A0A9P3G2Y7_9APHY|nr:hypothetical protein PsYK624_033540 [Phanerochaete sordida]